MTVLYIMQTDFAIGCNELAPILLGSKWKYEKQHLR